MFIIISEAGPTLWKVKVLDECWNKYESVITPDAKKTSEEFKKMYQID